MEQQGLSWSSQALAVWAKTGQEDDKSLSKQLWMNLPRHSMDAAATAIYLWHEWLPEGTQDFLASELNLSPDEAAQFLGWITGVHDLGKNDPSFVGQIEPRPGASPYLDRIKATGLTTRLTTDPSMRYPHSAGSYVGLLDWFAGRHPAASPSKRRKAGEKFSTIAAIVGAHHGLPVSAEAESRAADFGPSPGSAWDQVRFELVENLLEFTKAENAVEQISMTGISPPAQMLLTGLVIMADWIASNQSFFPLIGAEDGSSWDRADQAIAHLNLPASLPKKKHFQGDINAAYASRFNWPAGSSAFPSQQKAIEVGQSMETSGIVCIEAPMGEGKTEAALALAELLGEKFGKQGVMVAAPTMATSDALFTRVKAWAEAYAGAETFSLFLGHSKRMLNQQMSQVPREISDFAHIGNPADHETTIAHDWLSGRKTGILSNIVVGTIDQVLFMGLQSKHAMLRHLGLANKVVVIDECHAYSAYMNAYLGRVLEWLGTYNVPVVLLSATLPSRTRAKLISQYLAGKTKTQAQPAKIPETQDAYPIITYTDHNQALTASVQPSARRQHYEFELIDNNDAALQNIVNQVETEGGCLLIICNTVKKAQRTYEFIASGFSGETRLLHARFIAVDRVTKEQELVRLLGPKVTRGSGRPEKLIVVATQVVEQSLDVDFDAMVTDIAPMDLLLQRAGRVHRHKRSAEERPGWAKQPKIFVRGIDSSPHQKGPPEFEYDQTLIYPISLLINSLAILQSYSGKRISFPEDIPFLVRHAYETAEFIPQEWRNDYLDAVRTEEAERINSEARASTYMFPSAHTVMNLRDLWSAPSPDVDANPVGEQQGLAQVRDADPSLEVLLTPKTPTGYQSLPWLDSSDLEVFSQHVPSHDVAHVIATSSVRLPYGFSHPESFEKALTELEESTDPSWRQVSILRGQLQLNLDSNLRAKLAGRTLRYDQELGLIDETEKVTHHVEWLCCKNREA